MEYFWPNCIQFNFNFPKKCFFLFEILINSVYDWIVNIKAFLWAQTCPYFDHTKPTQNTTIVLQIINTNLSKRNESKKNIDSQTINAKMQKSFQCNVDNYDRINREISTSVK